MRTIVGRLTVGYALTLAATMLVFSVAVYFIQAPDPYSEIDDRLSVESNLISNIIFSHPASEPVIEIHAPDSQVLAPRLRQVFAAVEDYVVLVDESGRVFYQSGPLAGVQQVGDTIVITGAPETTPSTFNVLNQLASVAQEPAAEPFFAVYDAGPPVGLLRYFRRSIPLGEHEAVILMAAPSPARGFDVGRLGRALAVVGPIILFASIVLGYLVAGRTLRPMDVIINEIEAITDGRSLHRRVIEVKNTEELVRLTTTLNNMLVRLERNFLSLRRFTADASHELKTPLTVFRAGVERAITHPKAPPEVLEILEEGLVEINRMTELVESLLTLARADEGRAPLYLEQFDIRTLLSEIAETAGMLGEQAGISVSVNLPSRATVLPMDRSRIRQLFMNLLTNAIKYTPQGGQLSIDCRVRDGDVVVTVKDTGIGIASHELPHIFDRFWRADVARSRTGARSGAGLGLAICKWIAEAHGGSIIAESRRGAGSTFTVRLPLAADTEVVEKPTATGVGG